MKKREIINKLKSFGVKTKGRHTIDELRAKLEVAQSDTSKPGHNIGSQDIGSAIGAKQPHGVNK